MSKSICNLGHNKLFTSTCLEEDVDNGNAVLQARTEVLLCHPNWKSRLTARLWTL